MRTFTPYGWALIIAGAVVAFVLLFVVWGRLWSWLPWSAETRADRAEVAAETAQSDSTARGLEVAGGQEIARRVETFHHETLTIQNATAGVIAEARSAPDANEPMEAGANARLYFRDDELCGYAPRLNGCAATNPAGAR